MEVLFFYPGPKSISIYSSFQNNINKSQRRKDKIMLKCQVCGYEHESLITAAHLREHGMGTKEYRAQFPGHPIRVASAETKARIGAKINGRPNEKNRGKRSDETKAKMSAAVKAQFANGRVNGMTGRKHSEESKQQMSESSIGSVAWNKDMTMSEEFCQKVSDTKTGVPNLAKRGVKLSEETKEKIADSVAKHHEENGCSDETRQKISDSLQSYYTLDVLSRK